MIQPIAGGVADRHGTAKTLSLAVLMLILPLSFALRGKTEHSSEDTEDLSVVETLRRAFQHKSYNLLVAGFFVCGFHLAFITVHLPAYLVQSGLSPDVGSWALARIGLLWLATVPPTAALVSGFFGPKYMGMLYGFAFLSHQVGSFFGVWLGGVIFDRTGSYDFVWYLGIFLGLAATALHIPIKEKRFERFQVASPA